MRKGLLCKVLVILIVCAFMGFPGINSYSSQGENILITGEVEAIADDGSFIVVDGSKIFTEGDFLAGSYLEAGDVIAVTVKEDSSGLRAVSFKYFFEGELDLYGDIDETSSLEGEY